MIEHSLKHLKQKGVVIEKINDYTQPPERALPVRSIRLPALWGASLPELFFDRFVGFQLGTGKT